MRGGDIRTVLTLLATLLTSVGCETQFEPFVESDVAFTILGFLDTDADTQYVRVVPLRQVVERERDAQIDATVTSVQLDTGRREVWMDSVVVFQDGSQGYVFYSAFSAVPGATYELTVTRSDGASTTAVTAVPLRPGDPDSVHGAQNESDRFAPIFWPGVERVIDADVEYTVNRVSCDGGRLPPPETAKIARVRYENDDRGHRSAEGWRIDLDLIADREAVNAVLGVPTIDACVVLYSLRVRLATPSDGWDPPGGVWDEDVLIQPGTFSNVDGGLGWFGSVARTTVDWQLSLLAMTNLNYFEYFEPPFEPQN